ERAPLEVALSTEQLPAGVFRAHSPYPLTAFSFSEPATKDLAAIERILGRALREIRLDSNDLEQARSLAAAHGEGWQSIIVGRDVADQLAAAHVARALKELRRRERAARDDAGDRDNASPESPQVESRPADDSGRAERAAEDARRAEREAERQAREQATRF